MTQLWSLLFILADILNLELIMRLERLYRADVDVVLSSECFEVLRAVPESKCHPDTPGGRSSARLL